MGLSAWTLHRLSFTFFFAILSVLFGQLFLKIELCLQDLFQMTNLCHYCHLSKIWAIVNLNQLGARPLKPNLELAAPKKQRPQISFIHISTHLSFLFCFPPDFPATITIVFLLALKPVFCFFFALSIYFALWKIQRAFANDTAEFRKDGDH